MENKLKALKKEMRSTLAFAFFFRNNPMFVNRYYQMGIDAVGRKKYQNLPLVRNEWEGARNSFDKMYGLVCAWCKDGSAFDIDGKICQDVCEKFNDFVLKETDSLNKRLVSFENELVSLVKSSEKKEAELLFKEYIKLKTGMFELNSLKDSETDFSKSTEMIEKVVDLYKSLLELHS